MSTHQSPQKPSNMPVHKYRAFPQVDLPDRTWPSQTITKAPLWCSVDLRDGNQALIEPMDPDRKWKMFQKLVEVGFKEIEVGFPSASDTDFTFVREIIEQGAIPDDVKIQVLTQARPELITRTYEAIAGSKQAIVHLYNSTSTLQRKVVFRLDEDGIIEIAVKGATLCRELEAQVPDTDVYYEYSPESFTGTELPFAKRICDTVVDVFDPTPQKKTIINLPATVEMSSANIYGDMIEWMHRINIAMNMFTQGVDPELDISDINDLRRVAEHCNQLPIHPRHPWVGDLVYTAFSGSHQDAIKKGMEALEAEDSELFEVPYIPVDPTDIGRTYEDVVRVNSQSGKGGVAYLLKTEQGLDLPRRMQIEFTRVIQQITDDTGKEISGNEIFNEFASEYLDLDSPYLLNGYEAAQNAQGQDKTMVTARMMINGEAQIAQGTGSGTLDAFVSGLSELLDIEVKVTDYHEHSKGTGTDADAVAYVEILFGGRELWGCGLHSDITSASMRAIVSALNRAVSIKAQT